MELSPECEIHREVFELDDIPPSPCGVVHQSEEDCADCAALVDRYIADGEPCEPVANDLWDEMLAKVNRERIREVKE